MKFLFLVLLLIPFYSYSQELEVFKTDSITAVRTFIYLDDSGWFKSGAVIISRIKDFRTGKEFYGFAIATTYVDNRSREIPEGVTILIKHLDNTVTELYTESGDFSQRENTAAYSVGGRYVAFATTISTYSYSYSCEISEEKLAKIGQWGITKLRIDVPGPGWKDFDLLVNKSEVTEKLKQLAKMAKRVLELDMETVKPDSYSEF